MVLVHRPTPPARGASSRTAPRRGAIALTLLAATFLAVACSPSLDELSDGRSCGEGKKACLGTCVSTDDARYGCAAAACDACSFPNAEASCSQGACTIAICKLPYANCDGDEKNGCETNTDTNVERCGSCTTSCRKAAVPPNVLPLCVSGVCETQCNQGFGDCDGNASNGCETDMRVSSAHCGRCNDACTGAKTCQGGQCT